VGQAYSFLRMAETQRFSGDYFGCEENATQALKLLKRINNKEYLSETYNVLGRCYIKLLNFDRAIDCYDKSAKIAKDSISRCIVENNIASAYIDKKDYESAFTILSKLIIAKSVVSHTETYARVLNNLGNVCNTMGKPNALKYLENGLAIRVKSNDLTGTLASYIQLARYFLGKNKSTTLLYAQKAYKLATSLKSVDERLAALKILISVSPRREAEALRYITINDSLSGARLKAKTEFASIKYEAKYAEAENLKLKANETKSKLQAQKDNVFKTALTAAIIIVVLIGMFIVYIQTLKHKKAKRTEVYKTENRISKKIHDELASDIFETMMFTETLDFNTADKKETLLKRLDSVYEKTRDISRENNSISTGSDFYVVLIEMLARYKTETINVLPANAESVNWEGLGEYKKTTLYRVLQEFMVNMKKHSQATLVVIKFNIENKKLHVNYVDNGIGIKKNNFFYKNGLQNADIRIKSVNGIITFDETIKGLKISIVIPL